MEQEDINRLRELREDVQQAINDCRDADNEPMEELLHRVSAALPTLIAQAERVKVLEEALAKVLRGGNHLALLIGPDHPPYTATAREALEHYGSCDAYEIWCCWQAIMHARTALEQTGASNG